MPAHRRPGRRHRLRTDLREPPHGDARQAKPPRLAGVDRAAGRRGDDGGACAPGECRRRRHRHRHGRSARRRRAPAGPAALPQRSGADHAPPHARRHVPGARRRPQPASLDGGRPGDEREPRGRRDRLHVVPELCRDARRPPRPLPRLTPVRGVASLPRPRPRSTRPPVALCPVLASAVGFSRIDAKTPDHFFTGFPSYWNIVAFYLWGLGWPRLANAAVVVAFSIAVFVPIRYVYPSRTQALRPLTVALGLGWGAAVLAVLARPGTPPRAVVLASLGFPVYYALLSFALHASREAR